jgi:hypothetical protein
MVIFLLVARERRISLISMFAYWGQGRRLQLSICSRGSERVEVTVRYMGTAHGWVCPADAWLVAETEYSVEFVTPCVKPRPFVLEL